MVNTDHYNWRFQVDGEANGFRNEREQRRYYDDFYFVGTIEMAHAEADKLAEQFTEDTGLGVERVHFERCGMAPKVRR